MSVTTPTVPPYDNAETLLPRGVAQDFIGMIEERSIALELGRTMRVSSLTDTIPMIAFRAQAGWVAPQYGGRKPITEVRWTALEIKVEEVAAVVPVPNAWIADANFDVEGQVERELANAVTHAIDQAILFGTDAPASFPAGGVAAFATPVSAATALEAVDTGMSELEMQGILPNGIGSGAAIGTVLRQAWTAAGAMPNEVPTPNLYGVPVIQSLTWDSTVTKALLGGWNYLVIGMREDVTFGRSTEGVLFDENGDFVTSAFQDNVTLVKVYARLGCAIGQPLKANSNDVANPFVALDW